MNLKGHITAYWRTGLVGAALATVTGLLFLTVKFLGDGVIGLSYDWLFFFRGDIPVEGVTILFMDPDSEAALGQQSHATWDRSIHARLLERLREFEPRAVVFDVLFQTSPADTNADHLLAAAAKASGNVVVAAKSTPDVYGEGIVGWHQLTPPFPELRAAARWGVVEVAQERDKIFRSHYYLREQEMPSMAWRVAELTEAKPPEPYVRRWINYYGPPGTFPHFSYYKVFESGTNAILALELSKAISNKVVFVGGRYDIGPVGGKGSDDHPTPYTAWTGRSSTGVEISATAYLNLVRGDWLRRSSPWAEAAMILLCGIASGMGLAVLRPVPATLWSLAGFLFIGAIAVLLAWQCRVWVPWLVVGVVQIPCAFAVSVLEHTRRFQREKHALAQALAMASRGQGSPRMAAGSPTLALDEHRSPLASPSPLLAPDPGGGAVRSLARVAALPAVPDHELLRCIGKGAYGEVFLARDVLGSFHAVKIVHANSTHDPMAFEREFNGLKNFTPISRSHPGLVQILQVGRNDNAGYLYYVMEIGDDEQTGQKFDPDKYVARTLARDLKRQGLLPLPERLNVCILLAEALDFLHQQKLIHRDIKPSNIIFVDGKPKLADVGLVTEVVTGNRDNTIIGTPLRMAPEGPGRPTADIFGLGKLVYEAGFAMEVNRFPELPTEMLGGGGGSEWYELNRIVMRACHVEPQRRYQTAAELQADLMALRDRCPAQHARSHG